MTSRGHSSRDDRDRDRRRTARDDRPPNRDDPPAPSRTGRGETLNDFFMDGKGIHREVLQREICKYLGPEARSRPYNYNGVSGYTITAVRPFTSKMIDDLQELSRSYVNENREAARRGHQEIPYETSRTARQAVLNQGVEDTYDQQSYAAQVAYPIASPQSGYPVSTRVEYAPTQAGVYPGSMYPSQGSSFAQGSNYGPPSAYPSSTRPGTTDSYGSAYGRDRDPYGDESPRPLYTPGRPREPRVDPRIDPRDPRLDPRTDPRSADPRYQVQDSRMEYAGDIREPLRADPRLITSSYSYPANSPAADVQMRYNDDYPTASATMGRGGQIYPSSRAQTGYDPRESASIRDPYRHEPIREEPRRRR